MYNLLIGGEAGQGIDTMAGLLAKLLKKSGYSVFIVRDLMSRIRGGHNTMVIRFGDKEIQSHSGKLDGVIALDDATVTSYTEQLCEKGFILCDAKVTQESPKIIKLRLNDIAGELLNKRLAGSIAIGAVLKLFGEELQNVEEIVQSEFKAELAQKNIEAVKIGFELTEKRFEKQSGGFADNMMISGCEAIGLGAIAAGLRFFTAYPMSPSTAIMVYLAQKSVQANILVEQAEDEIGAINMALGASFAGARAMTATSGGGFSLMVEALGLAGIAEIPIVIVDMQRPGPATGMPTRTEQSDLKFVISASQGEFPRMVIALRHHADAFYQTVRAFEIAQKYQIPVIILCDQYLGDGVATLKPFLCEQAKAAHLDVSIDDEYKRYQLTKDGISPMLVPGKSLHLVEIDSDEHDEYGHITESAQMRKQMVEKRMRKLEGLKTILNEPEFLGEAEYDVLLIGWGSTYGPIKEALEILNEKKKERYAALVFGDVYPLPQKLLKEKAAGAKRIVNVEQNATGQLMGLIREQTGIKSDEQILNYDGRQITGEQIALRFVKEV